MSSLADPKEDTAYGTVGAFLHLFCLHYSTESKLGVKLVCLPLGVRREGQAGDGGALVSVPANFAPLPLTRENKGAPSLPPSCSVLWELPLLLGRRAVRHPERP